MSQGQREQAKPVELFNRSNLYLLCALKHVAACTLSLCHDTQCSAHVYACLCLYLLSAPIRSETLGAKGISVETTNKHWCDTLRL